MGTEQMQYLGAENPRRKSTAEIEEQYRELEKAAEMLEELSMDFGVSSQVMRFDPSQGIRRLGERHMAPTAKEIEEMARRMRNLAKTGLEQLGKATGQPSRFKSLAVGKSDGLSSKIINNKMPALLMILLVVASLAFFIFN